MTARVARRAHRRWLAFAVRYERRLPWITMRAWERYHGHPMSFTGEVGWWEGIRWMKSERQ